MKNSLFLIPSIVAIAFLALLVGALSNSRHRVQAAVEESPLCSMPPDSGAPWLPKTPEPQETVVPAPRPASDCGFYRPAWQRFLVATQPTLDGPTFLTYPSFDEIFTPSTATAERVISQQHLVLSLTPRNMQRPNIAKKKLQELLDQTQAGLFGATGGVLIDQHGRFIYYAIHVNPAFLSFLSNHHLTTLDGLNQIDKNLTFPDTGGSSPSTVVELKSAWMIVANQESAPTYFVVPAKVQRYIVTNGSLVPELDKNTQKPVFDNVWAALIAIHVVFTLPGHPEMIWSTFEHVHVDIKGQTIRDNAPAAPFNPSKTPPGTVISTEDFPLYKAGTTAGNANKPIDKTVLAQHWDSGTQSFTKGGTLQTSVYRPYPGSKSDGKEDKDSAEDDEIILINKNAAKMFSDAKGQGLIRDSDLRQNYRLVGAVWLNDPLTGPKATFKVGQPFTNPINQATDEPDAELAGEGRLGSTAMESFTEFEEGAPNCFSCHDTQAVRGRSGKTLLPPALLNVSHVMSRFKDLQPATNK
jgi:hypothetical protein